MKVKKRGSARLYVAAGMSEISETCQIMLPFLES